MVDAFQLTTAAAEAYEAQSVVTMFRPLSEAVLGRVEVRPEDRVLDVACGTGIMGRVIVETVPGAGPVTGIDLNGPMLAVAAALTRDRAAQFDWHQGDVTAMPFESNRFSLAFCQQGLQFFPDRPAALAEMHRVLQPGGRLVVLVWSAVSPLMAALADSLRKHFNDRLATQAVAPFAFRDRATIEDLLTGAGFSDMTHEILSIERHMGVARESIPRQIAAHPVGEEVAAGGSELMQTVVAEVAASMRLSSLDQPFSFHQDTHLFVARVGE